MTTFHALLWATYLTVAVVFSWKAVGLVLSDVRQRMPDRSPSFVACCCVLSAAVVGAGWPLIMLSALVMLVSRRSRGKDEDDEEGSRS